MNKIKEMILGLWTVGAVLVAIALGVFTLNIGVSFLLLGCYFIGLGFLFARYGEEKKQE